MDMFGLSVRLESLETLHPSHHMEGVFKSIPPGNYQRPPLFYGTWSQLGSGKRKALTKRKPARQSAITPRRKPVKTTGKGLLLEQNSTFNCIPILGTIL